MLRCACACNSLELKVRFSEFRRRRIVFMLGCINIIFKMFNTSVFFKIWYNVFSLTVSIFISYLQVMIWTSWHLYRLGKQLLQNIFRYVFFEITCFFFLSSSVAYFLQAIQRVIQSNRRLRERVMNPYSDETPMHGWKSGWKRNKLCIYLLLGKMIYLQQ